MEGRAVLGTLFCCAHCGQPTVAVLIFASPPEASWDCAGGRSPGQGAEVWFFCCLVVGHSSDSLREGPLRALGSESATRCLRLCWGAAVWTRAVTLDSGELQGSSLGLSWEATRRGHFSLSADKNRALETKSRSLLTCRQMKLLSFSRVDSYLTCEH